MENIETLDRFEEYLAKRASAGTVRVYIHALKLWLTSLNGQEPTQKAAQDYIDMLTQSGLSASTINLRGQSIIRWFKWQGKSITIDMPTVRLGEPEYLTMQEVSRLLASCRNILEKAIITVLFDTAIRASELLGITLDDIDWENGLVTVTRKGGRREDVNISEKALEVLSEWIESRTSKSRYVFMDLTYYDLWLTVRGVGKRAGIKIHPHLLRHSRAVQMRKSGAKIEDIKDHLGHVNISTTANLYSRFKAIDLKERIPSW